jgi:hypothetical protein
MCRVLCFFELSKKKQLDYWVSKGIEEVDFAFVDVLAMLTRLSC